MYLPDYPSRLISVWDNEDVLRSFARENWNLAVIPPGMERFVFAGRGGLERARPKLKRSKDRQEYVSRKHANTR